MKSTALKVRITLKKAHEDYLEKVSHRGRKSILTSDIKDDIESKIKDSHWAPETVAAMSKSKFCFKSIYNWIDNNLLDIQLENLPDKGIRRRRAAETRGKDTQQGKYIEDRPEDDNKRLGFGHFEGDIVLSGKTKGQALGTFLERMSRLYIVTRLSGRNSAAMTEAILDLAEKLGTKGMKSITVDHGKEFSGYKQPTLTRHMNVELTRIVTVLYAALYLRDVGRPIEEASDEELMRIN
ncbi:IS30 family transposase [Limosilactobacillus equigenerosi]|uniref:IS30 family transposase n=1 Tax=Limosilactobacillus equigenerosi TaxID=417373 RepID=UPI000B00FA0F|nr:IS30 family transposase [Limosilactobacillus equigenerosi]